MPAEIEDRIGTSDEGITKHGGIKRSHRTGCRVGKSLDHKPEGLGGGLRVRDESIKGLFTLEGTEAGVLVSSAIHAGGLFVC